MPSKHVDEQTWKKVQDETVKAVIATKTSLKDTEVLKILIKKGLEHINESDYIHYIQRKNG